jgi:hypothetical protein
LNSEKDESIQTRIQPMRNNFYEKQQRKLEGATSRRVSPKERLSALLLCFFLGWAGAHRFYVGKHVTGLLWLLSGGVFLIGWLLDFIMIITGSFTDKDGKRLENWTK